MPISFIGQEKMINQFELYARVFQEKLGLVDHCNLLLSGRTGMGKTTSVMVFLGMLNPNADEWIQYVPSETVQDITDLLNKHKTIKYIFIDEAHLLKNPEWLYPFLDDKTKQRIFILATNKLGDLNPALLNGRLHKIVFEEYTQDDLRWMVKDSLCESLKEIPINWIDKIIKAAKRNPRRICRDITGKINLSTLNLGIPKTEMEFIKFLNFAGYDVDGYDAEERLYIDYLKKSGGKVGLKTLASATKLDIKVISEVIEPDLLATGTIEIAAGGRIYIGE